MLVVFEEKESESETYHLWMTCSYLFTIYYLHNFLTSAAGSAAATRSFCAAVSATVTTSSHFLYTLCQEINKSKN